MQCGASSRNVQSGAPLLGFIFPFANSSIPLLFSPVFSNHSYGKKSYDDECYASSAVRYCSKLWWVIRRRLHWTERHALDPSLAVSVSVKEKDTLYAEAPSGPGGAVGRGPKRTYVEIHREDIRFCRSHHDPWVVRVSEAALGLITNRRDRL